MRFPINISGRHTNTDLLNGLNSGVVPGVWTPRIEWLCHVDVRRLTLPAATTLAIDLNDLQARMPFPVDVQRLAGAYVRLRETFEGGVVSAVTAQLGYAGDADAILEAMDVGEGEDLGVKQAVGDDYGTQYEADAEPQLLLTSTGGNLSLLEQGILTVAIPYTPVPR